MSYEMLTSPVELTDAQLDAVAAGAKQEGLVNVNVEDAVKDINVNVAAQALTSRSGQTFTPIQP
jgi:hypothetical protein